MQPLPFSALGPLARGTAIEGVEFRLTKISRPIPMGQDGTMQICDAVDRDGTAGTVVFFDREEVPPSWAGPWIRATSTPGAPPKQNQRFGVQIGDYKNNKRIEIKPKAQIDFLDEQPQGRPQPQQRQQPAQNGHQQRQPDQGHQPQQQAPQERAQRPPRPAPPPPPPPDGREIRTLAARLAYIHMTAEDAAVHYAYASKLRHGITRTPEQISGMAMSIAIEIARQRPDWARIPIEDLTTHEMPKYRLHDLLNGPSQS